MITGSWNPLFKARINSKLNSTKLLKQIKSEYCYNRSLPLLEKKASSSFYLYPIKLDSIKNYINVDTFIGYEYKKTFTEDLAITHPPRNLLLHKIPKIIIINQFLTNPNPFPI